MVSAADVPSTTRWPCVKLMLAGVARDSSWKRTGAIADSFRAAGYLSSTPSRNGLETSVPTPEADHDSLHGWSGFAGATTRAGGWPGPGNRRDRQTRHGRLRVAGGRGRG